MPSDLDLKIVIYRFVATSARVPTVAEVADLLQLTHEEIKAGFQRLFKSRVLVLEEDAETIRMAPPFSGVPTQHVVKAAGKSFYANCAWDALGVLAALHEEGVIHSRCEQSLEPLTIDVHKSGPNSVPCIIHFAVPAAHWWDNIIFT